MTKLFHYAGADQDQDLTSLLTEMCMGTEIPR